MLLGEPQAAHSLGGSAAQYCPQHGQNTDQAPSSSPDSIFIGPM
jgi:hypothetical protein